MVGFIVTFPNESGAPTEVRLITPTVLKKDIKEGIKHREKTDVPTPNVDPKIIATYSAEVAIANAGKSFTEEDYNTLVRLGVDTCIGFSELTPLQYETLVYNATKHD